MAVKNLGPFDSERNSGEFVLGVGKDGGFDGCFVGGNLCEGGWVGEVL